MSRVALQDTSRALKLRACFDAIHLGVDIVQQRLDLCLADLCECLHATNHEAP
jgi:hypothetical protein